jgi:hypothetical protein
VSARDLAAWVPAPEPVLAVQEPVARVRAVLAQAA